ncbi:SAS053 family protein [Macrococcus capreoli]|nr:SAS053 family protein [Macrococcus sp. TMW 2.2395]MCU7557328.1 SAS053 family protein [Macrococcus sp. TMW 2.2395]
MSTSHDNKNEMVSDFDDVVKLGNEMEQISEQNAEALEDEHHHKEDSAQ